ncbi:hypothetical protein [Natrinema sp. HArc-T2]|uniref:hypothetical protein n=1 Tax=Natrinema sp. HArc-T2 TaxID=3242701 RepID=UPI00359CEED2
MTEEAVAPILKAESDISVGNDLKVAMNPEFLRIGSAAKDFLESDKKRSLFDQ